MKTAVSFVFVMALFVQLSAQDQIRATSVKHGSEHNLLLPQQMKFRFNDGRVEKHQINALSGDLLLGDEITIPIQELDHFKASRKKSTAVKIFGYIVTAAGTFLMASSIAFMADDWGTAGGNIAGLVIGGGITGLGIALAKNRRSYTPGEWRFDLLPEENPALNTLSD